MNFLAKLLAPIVRQVVALVVPMLWEMLRRAIVQWYEEALARKRLAADQRRIEDAFKNPDRREAARQLNDVFKGNPK